MWQKVILCDVCQMKDGFSCVVYMLDGGTDRPLLTKDRRAPSVTQLMHEGHQTFRETKNHEVSEIRKAAEVM